MSLVMVVVLMIVVVPVTVLWADILARLAGVTLWNRAMAMMMGETKGVMKVVMMVGMATEEAVVVVVVVVVVAVVAVVLVVRPSHCGVWLPLVTGQAVACVRVPTASRPIMPRHRQGVVTCSAIRTRGLPI